MDKNYAAATATVSLQLQLEMIYTIVYLGFQQGLNLLDLAQSLESII